MSYQVTRSTSSLPIPIKEDENIKHSLTKPLNLGERILNSYLFSGINVSIEQRYTSGRVFPVQHYTLRWGLLSPKLRLQGINYRGIDLRVGIPQRYLCYATDKKSAFFLGSTGSTRQKYFFGYEGSLHALGLIAEEKLSTKNFDIFKNWATWLKPQTISWFKELIKEVEAKKIASNLVVKEGLPVAIAYLKQLYPNRDDVILKQMAGMINFKWGDINRILMGVGEGREYFIHKFHLTEASKLGWKKGVNLLTQYYPEIETKYLKHGLASFSMGRGSAYTELAGMIGVSTLIDYIAEKNGIKMNQVARNILSNGIPIAAIETYKAARFGVFDNGLFTGAFTAAENIRLASGNALAAYGANFMLRTGLDFIEDNYKEDQNNWIHFFTQQGSKGRFALELAGSLGGQLLYSTYPGLLIGSALTAAAFLINKGSSVF